MNILEELFLEKWQTLVALYSLRVERLQPYLVYLGLVALAGAIEGNAWREDRLYAGFYSYIFSGAVLLLLAVMVACAVWLMTPEWLSLPALAMTLTAPAFMSGWGLAAGRPIIR